VLSAPDWLDVHYAACAPQYEALLDAAGFEPGMRVLDAGCGTGAFLPLLRRATGPGGRVYALDLAPENLETARSTPSLNANPVQGSVLGLPFPRGVFDGAWCANVLQYFDDAEAMQVIEELARVVKPSGIVAVKDVDMSALRISPAPVFLGAHLAEACIRGDGATKQSFGSLRGRELRRFLERAGLREVRQTSLLIEHWAPLSDAGMQLWCEWLPYLASLALSKGVPAEDQAVWRRVATPEQAHVYVSQKEFYACELQVTAVGRVP
jgi:SAM-dependent methyltransferase